MGWMKWDRMFAILLVMCVLVRFLGMRLTMILEYKKLRFHFFIFIFFIICLFFLFKL